MHARFASRMMVQMPTLLTWLLGGETFSFTTHVTKHKLRNVPMMDSSQKRDEMNQALLIARC